MIKEICPDCAGYAMILRSLYESARQRGERCSFCNTTAGNIRRIEWQAQERDIGTAALSVLPYHCAGVGKTAIVALRQLETLDPDRPAKGGTIGPLIRHNLAEMQQGEAVITAKGRAYLTSLRLDRFRLP